MAALKRRATQNPINKIASSTSEAIRFNETDHLMAEFCGFSRYLKCPAAPMTTRFDPEIPAFMVIVPFPTLAPGSPCAWARHSELHPRSPTADRQPPRQSAQG